jgi:hypothetical protein
MPPVKIPSTAAYLASISLECSIKARLLYRGGFENVDDLQLKQPAIFKALFSSKHGHDLQKLADNIRLPSLVGLEGKIWNDDDVWKRMASSGRPYSLRYGSEELTSDDAKAEVHRARELSGMLLSGLRSPKKRWGRK